MKLIVIGIIVGLVLAIGCFFGGAYVEKKSDNDNKILHDEQYMLANKIDMVEARFNSKIDEVNEGVKELLRYARSYNSDLTSTK